MAQPTLINEERLVTLFKDLCLVDAPALDEMRSVEWTKAYLAPLGLEMREDDAGARIGGNANNLIVTLKGNLEFAPRIFLSAHFDTVEPTAGLEILEEDGVFKTDGTTILGADDKSGMAPMIEAVRHFLDSGEAHGDVVLLLSVAEEIGLKGAAALDIESLGLDYGYVLDTGPPVGSFVTRTATHDNLTITVRGRPAHAGKDPENGINALQVAARAIEGMRMGRIGPETTANLGIVSGGTGVNVVMPSVTIRAEARSTSVEDLDAQVAHMTERFESAAREFGATVEFVHDRHYSNYHVGDDEEVVRVAQEAARALGLSGALRTTLGGSDANVFNAKEVPSIVVATGMTAIHTHEERISRADLVTTAELCIELIRAAARRERR